MGFNSGIKEHNIMNDNILMPINKCNCLINTAIELYSDIELLGEYRIESYRASNNKRQRTIIYKDGQAISACYYELESGFVIYGTTIPEQRQKGIYKQLKAYVYMTTKLKLWSQFQSADYLQAFNR